MIQATGVSEREIMGKCRTRHIKNARWMVVHLTRKHKNYSYPMIAHLMNMKDHTSALYAEKHFPDRVREFPELEDMLETAEFWISQIPNHQALLDDSTTPAP